MENKHAYHKFFIVVIIGLAFLAAILASVLPPERMSYIIYVTRFFDVMLPILAFGALIKYLCTCGGKCE